MAETLGVAAAANLGAMAVEAVGMATALALARDRVVKVMMEAETVGTAMSEALRATTAAALGVAVAAASARDWEYCVWDWELELRMLRQFKKFHKMMDEVIKGL
uniref:Uncharacterized protein n=1 Tax=Oryza rufipogon TaxID=4529 RepID=A0A0E0MY09_ORYRU